MKKCACHGCNLTKVRVPCPDQKPDFAVAHGRMVCKECEPSADRATVEQLKTWLAKSRQNEARLSALLANAEDRAATWHEQWIWEVENHGHEGAPKLLEEANELVSLLVAQQKLHVELMSLARLSLWLMEKTGNHSSSREQLIEKLDAAIASAEGNKS